MDKEVFQLSYPLWLPELLRWTRTALRGPWRLPAPSSAGRPLRGSHLSPSAARQIWLSYLPVLQENPENRGWINSENWEWIIYIPVWLRKPCGLWAYHDTEDASRIWKRRKIHQTCSAWKWSDMQYRRPPNTFGEAGKLKWITHVASVMAKSGTQSSVRAAERESDNVTRAGVTARTLTSSSRGHTAVDFRITFYFFGCKETSSPFFPQNATAQCLHSREKGSPFLAWKMSLITNPSGPYIFHLFYTCWLLYF